MSITQDSTPSIKSGRGANVALWALQVLLAAAFLMVGALKLAGPEMMVKQFETLGLGQWFRYLTGALEVVAAVLLLVPRWSGLGALLIIPIMLGAAVVVGGAPASGSVTFESGMRNELWTAKNLSQLESSTTSVSLSMRTCAMRLCTRASRSGFRVEACHGDEGYTDRHELDVP